VLLFYLFLAVYGEKNPEKQMKKRIEERETRRRKIIITLAERRHMINKEHACSEAYHMISFAETDSVRAYVGTAAQQFFWRHHFLPIHCR
jgi:protease II